MNLAENLRIYHNAINVKNTDTPKITARQHHAASNVEKSTIIPTAIRRNRIRLSVLIVESNIPRTTVDAEPILIYKKMHPRPIRPNVKNLTNSNYVPTPVSHTLSYANAAKKPLSQNNPNPKSNQTTNYQSSQPEPLPNNIINMIFDFIKQLITPLISKIKSFISTQLLPNIINP